MGGIDEEREGGREGGRGRKGEGKGERVRDRDFKHH